MQGVENMLGPVITLSQRSILQCCAIVPILRQLYSADAFKRWDQLGVGRAFRGLRQLLVLGQSHVPSIVSMVPAKKTLNIHSPPQLDQNCLHGKLPLPLRQAGELGRIDLLPFSQPACPSQIISSLGHLYLSVALAHTGNVDLGNERHLWRDVRIVLAAVNLDTVYAVLMYTLRRVKS